ncbi:MAG: hypothetical protein M1839_006450 [Geoglossum umbratile]|nr:MAG: hypothetical protein M1839_006450 [Geoglossum umbratile]
MLESFENLLEQQSGLSSEQSEHLMRKMVKSNNQLLAEVQALKAQNQQAPPELPPPLPPNLSLQMKKQKRSTRKRALTGAEASDRQQKAMTRAQTRAKAVQIATALRKMQTRNQKVVALLADQL